MISFDAFYKIIDESFFKFKFTFFVIYCILFFDNGLIFLESSGVVDFLIQRGFKVDLLTKFIALVIIFPVSNQVFTVFFIVAEYIISEFFYSVQYWYLKKTATKECINQYCYETNKKPDQCVTLADLERAFHETKDKYFIDLYLKHMQMNDDIFKVKMYTFFSVFILFMDVTFPYKEGKKTIGMWLLNQCESEWIFYSILLTLSLIVLELTKKITESKKWIFCPLINKEKN